MAMMENSQWKWNRGAAWPDLTAIRSARNGNETVAGAALEAFARWLRRRYAPAELQSVASLPFRRAIPCC